MFAIDIGVFRIRVDPADFLIRVADVAISNQREVFSACGMQFRQRLG